MTTEALLLQRLRSDDSAALEEIIHLYSPYVFSVLSRRLGLFQTAEDLEELASDVFFSLWQHRKRLRSEHLRGWLSKTTENAAKSFLRRQRRITISVEDCISLPDRSVEALGDTALRRLLIHRALSSLGPENREIFIRYYFEGSTVQEISRVLSMNPATVKSRLRRGRQKLKEILTEGGFILED